MTTPAEMRRILRTVAPIGGSIREVNEASAAFFAARNAERKED